MLYNRNSDFTKVQTKIEAKNLDFLSLMGFVSLNCPFFYFLMQIFIFNRS